MPQMSPMWWFVFPWFMASLVMTVLVVVGDFSVSLIENMDSKNIEKDMKQW